MKSHSPALCSPAPSSRHWPSAGDFSPYVIGRVSAAHRLPPEASSTTAICGVGRKSASRSLHDVEHRKASAEQFTARPASSWTAPRW